MLTYTLNRILPYFAVLLALATFSCDKRSPRTPAIPEIPTTEIRSCDLVFRLGRSIESSVIASQGSYSHIGIIIERDSARLVAHIEPSREGSELTRYESVEEFFHPDRASAGCVMRINELDSVQRHKIESYLLACKDITFDHDYTLSDTTQMYCTELVHRALMTANIDLIHGIRHNVPIAKESVILPSDMLRDERLTKVWSY